jgi:hypothetical protein
MDTVTPASLVYVRTLGGLRTAVRFPDLAERLGSGRLVAKAELVVPIAGSFYPYYLPPTQLFLFLHLPHTERTCAASLPTWATRKPTPS